MYRTIAKAQFPAETGSIGQAIEFVEKNLNPKAESKQKVELMLSVEEILVQLCGQAPNPNCKITIQVAADKKENCVKLSCLGKAFSLDDVSSLGNLVECDQVEEEQQQVISGMVLKLYADRIRIRHSRNTNHVTLKMQPLKARNTTMIAMAAGILAGILVRFILPATVVDFLMTNVANVITDLFMNGIQMVLAPLIFFSMADAISGFSDLKTFGRLGAKVMGMYSFTTILASIVGISLTMLCHPGSPNLLPDVQALIGTTEVGTVGEVSIINTIVSIVPSNMMSTFVESNMLQVIFLGIIFGIAGGLIGDASESVRRFVSVGNTLFLKITSMIVYFLPAAVFCIMMNLVATTGAEVLLSIIEVLLVFTLLVCCMQLVYYLLLFINGVNPISFIKGFFPAMLTAFSTCSSSATMPVTMKCLDQMKVSPKIYSFSIPLGATINMDGATMEYLLYCLFMARVFGIDMTLGIIVPLCVTVFLLSMATPGTPGSGIAMIAMLFSQIGVPPGAAGFIIAAMTMCDFICTSNNVVGDAVVTTVIAKREGLIGDDIR